MKKNQNFSRKDVISVASLARLKLSEKEIAKVARKSLVTLKNIKKNEVFSSENIGIKRPGTGIEPKFLDKILGKKAKKIPPAN